MAVAGESECRPVMACGAGTWGDIAVDATTVYVKQDYAGGDSDGSADRPWASIGAAFNAAAPGALIAIAAGSYIEDVLLTGKAVRLAGICPERVAIVGSSAGAVVVRGGASGSHLSGVSVTGAAIGLVVTDATDVTAERIWAHDNAFRGIDVEDTLGPASLSLSDSLVESNHDAGVFVSGASVTLERSAVRGTLPDIPSQTHGEGVLAQTNPVTSGRAALAITDCVLEGNHSAGVEVLAGDVSIEASVIRNTLPQMSDGLGGRGIWVQGHLTQPIVSTLRLGTSLVAQSGDLGVFAHGTHAVIERSVVRDTVVQGAGSEGVSVQVQIDDVIGTEASAIVRDSLIERSQGIGIFFAQAPATVERVAVRDVHVIGIYIKGTRGTVDQALVQRTSPPDASRPFGRGMGIELWCEGTAQSCRPETRAEGVMRNSVIEDGVDIGVMVGGMDATIENVRVSRTNARPNGTFGDGVAVFGGDAIPASATITRMLIEASSRAGLATFDAPVSLGDTSISCATVALNAEVIQVMPPLLTDLGGNSCGCPQADGTCKVLSSGLEPPQQLP
jgi:hypothetical protein